MDTSQNNAPETGWYAGAFASTVKKFPAPWDLLLLLIVIKLLINLKDVLCPPPAHSITALKCVSTDLKSMKLDALLASVIILVKGNFFYFVFNFFLTNLLL